MEEALPPYAHSSEVDPANIEQVQGPQPSIADTISDFWAYLKQPVYLPRPNLKTEQVWRPFLHIYLLNLVGSLSAAALVYGLMELLGLAPLEGHKINAFFENSPLPLVFIMLAVVAPVLEETFFRWPLRFSRLRLLALFTGIALFVLVPVLELLAVSATVQLGILLVLLAITIAMMAADRWHALFYLFWKRNFSFIFYGLASLFAFAHLSNFSSLDIPYSLIPLLVVPQLLTGLCCGYLRMKYGMPLAILNHCLFNALLVVISVAFA